MTLAQEQLLWAYIDGECSEMEQQQVQLLLNNPKIRKEFDTMLQMHQDFQQYFSQKNTQEARIRKLKINLPIE